MNIRSIFISAALATSPLLTACPGGNDDTGTSATEGDMSCGDSSPDDIVVFGENCGSTDESTSTSTTTGGTTGGGENTSSTTGTTTTGGASIGYPDETGSTSGTTSAPVCEDLVYCNKVIEHLKERKGVYQKPTEDGSGLIAWAELDEFERPHLSDADDLIASQEERGIIQINPNNLDPELLCASYQGPLTGEQYSELLEKLMHESCDGVDVPGMVTSYNDIWGPQLTEDELLTSCEGEAEFWVSIFAIFGIYRSFDTIDYIGAGTKEMNSEGSGVCGNYGVNNPVGNFYFTVTEEGKGGTGIIQTIKVLSQGTVTLFKGSGMLETFGLTSQKNPLPLVLSTGAVVNEPKAVKVGVAGTNFFADRKGYPICIAENPQDCQP